MTQDRLKGIDDYWKDQLAEVYEHIKRDCAPGDYDWNRRGIIVADDETGELLALVKEVLKYDELDAAGKVNEITVDKHWPLDSFYHRVYFEEERLTF